MRSSSGYYGGKGGKVSSSCHRLGKFLAKVVDQRLNALSFNKKANFLLVSFFLTYTHLLDNYSTTSKILGTTSPSAPLIVAEKRY